MNEKRRDGGAVIPRHVVIILAFGEIDIQSERGEDALLNEAVPHDPHR
jgi:hypothetical protein